MKFFIRRNPDNRHQHLVSIDSIKGPWITADSTHYVDAIANSDLKGDLTSDQVVNGNRIFWRYAYDRELFDSKFSDLDGIIVGVVADKFSIYTDGYTEWVHEDT